MNNTDLTTTSDGKHTFNLTNGTTGKYKCTLTDECESSIDLYIDINMGARDCSPYKITGVKVYQPSHLQITPIGGIHEVEKEEDITFSPTIVGSPIAKVEWSSNVPGAKLPILKAGTYIIEGGIATASTTITYTVTATAENGCITDPVSVIVKTMPDVDPACVISSTFTPSVGQIISGEGNNFIWLVPIGTTNPTIHSSDKVREWILSGGDGHDYSYSRTVNTSTRVRIGITVGDTYCPGVITIMSNEAQHNNCERVPGSEAVTAIFISSKNDPAGEITESFKYTEDYNMHAFVIPNPGITKLAEKGYVALWFTAPTGTSPALQPLNGASQSGNRGPIIFVPKKSIPKDTYVFTQVIQLDSGCSSMRETQSR